MEEAESNVYFTRIVKTSAFAFIAVMLSKVLGYSYKIVIARYFDAEVYGLFSLSMIIIGIAVSLAGAGLFEGLVRQISIYRGQKKRRSIISLVITSRNFLIISGFALFGIVFLSAPTISNLFDEPRLTIFIQVMSLAIPFILLANLFLSVLRSYEMIKTQSVLTNVLQNTTKFFILLFFIFIGLQIASVPLSYLFAYVVLALVAGFYGKKILFPVNVSKPKLKDGKKMLVMVMKYSWPLMFIGVLTSIFYWTDSLLIGYYIGVGNVGIYNAAITLIVFLGIVPELFIQLLFPVIALNISQNKNKFVNLLINRVTKWIIVINSFIALACFFFAPQLVFWLFGQDFMNAVISLRILSIGALFTNLAAYFINLLTVAAKTKQILYNLIIVAILNFVLDILMIPSLGLNGAAIATSISGFILFLITARQVKKNYLFSPLEYNSIRTIIIVLITFWAGAVILFLSSSVLMTFLIGIILIILYLIILIHIGLFDEQDIDLFKKIVWKAIFYTGFKGFRSKTFLT